MGSFLHEPSRGQGIICPNNGPVWGLKNPLEAMDDGGDRGQHELHKLLGEMTGRERSQTDDPPSMGVEW